MLHLPEAKLLQGSPCLKVNGHICALETEPFLFFFLGGGGGVFLFLV